MEHGYSSTDIYSDEESTSHGEYDSNSAHEDSDWTPTTEEQEKTNTCQNADTRYKCININHHSLESWSIQLLSTGVRWFWNEGLF